MEELTGQLGETGNQSATRGYRTTEPARIAGEGEIASLLKPALTPSKSCIPQMGFGNLSLHPGCLSNQAAMP